MSFQKRRPRRESVGAVSQKTRHPKIFENYFYSKFLLHFCAAQKYLLVSQKLKINFKEGEFFVRE